MEALKNDSKIHTHYWGTNNSDELLKGTNLFRSPNLPYSYSAMENIADAQHFKNHFLNFHVKSYEDFQRMINNSQIEKMGLLQLFKNENDFDKQLIDIAGTIYNHQLFWDNLSPYCGNCSQTLQKAIDDSFGSIFELKEQFIITGMNQDCCGWLWLLKDQKSKLHLITTSQNRNPLMLGTSVRGTPILAIDLWEHAYSNKFLNNKTGYLKRIWMYINWTEVSNRFKQI